MKTYQVTLPDEFAAFVDRMIAEGQWESVDDLMLHSLMLAQEDLAAGADMDQNWLRAEIQNGIDSANRGELLDGETVMARLIAKLEASETRRS
jgi:putative addiction module CopG family antidote